MKKQCLLLICLIAFLLIFSGCKQDIPIGSNNTSNENIISQISEPLSSNVINSNYLISQKKALQIVIDNLPEKDYNIDFEGVLTIDNKDYYKFHVYTVSTQPIIDADGNEVIMSFTKAWPYVDCNTGELFKESFDP